MKGKGQFRRAQKQNDGKKFKVQTDACSDIIANKLGVTFLMKSLMERYVDVAQIHYDDHDERFKMVEETVRSTFEFDPPLREGWFQSMRR